MPEEIFETVVYDRSRYYLAEIDLSDGEILDWDAKLTGFYGDINAVGINQQGIRLCFFGFYGINTILDEPASYFSGITIYPTIETGTLTSNTFLSEIQSMFLIRYLELLMVVILSM